MDSASLRIRFAPLLTNIQKSVDSKCCIEIVPEVSGFHNLDKIDWKIDDGLIEYTIPMTYKIIIKKEQSLENKCDIDKTYHSCVDLLQGNSVSNVDMASGDVTRIISDPYILSRVTSDTDKWDLILNDNMVNLNRIYQIQDKTVSIETVTINETSVSSRVALAKTFAIDIGKYETVVVTTNEVNKNSDSMQKICKTNTKAREYENEKIIDSSIVYLDDKQLKTKNTNLKPNIYKPSLSLSPICSFSTYNDCPIIKHLKSIGSDSKNSNNSTYSLICAIPEFKSDEAIKCRLNGTEMTSRKVISNMNKLSENAFSLCNDNKCISNGYDHSSRDETKYRSNVNKFCPARVCEGRPNGNKYYSRKASHSSPRGCKLSARKSSEYNAKKNKNKIFRPSKKISNENLYTLNKIIESRSNGNESSPNEVSIYTTTAKKDEYKPNDSIKKAYNGNECSPSESSENKTIRNKYNPCKATEYLPNENKHGRSNDGIEGPSSETKNISNKTSRCETSRNNYNPSKSSENIPNRNEYSLNAKQTSPSKATEYISTLCKQSKTVECTLENQSNDIRKHSKGTECNPDKPLLKNEDNFSFKQLSKEHLFYFNKQSKANQPIPTQQHIPNQNLSAYVHRPTQCRELIARTCNSPNIRLYCNDICKETTVAICENKKQKTKRFLNRELPEVRVSYFIQILENEFFPLRVILNEIQTKCIAFGIFFNITNRVTGQTAFVPNGCFLYKNLSNRDVRKRCGKNVNCDNQTAKCKNISSQSDDTKEISNCTKNAKSNRVVYTISFDG